MSDTTTTLPVDDSDIRRMSFEEALESLERIVSDLERGDVQLEHSIRIYERGEKLKSRPTISVGNVCWRVLNRSTVAL